MKKLLLLILVPLSLQANICKNLGNFICALITEDDASSQHTKEVKKIAYLVDPTIKINCVRKFNQLGRLLFGNNNTIALPFLNYLVINDKALDRLDYETQKFYIGRSIVKLTQPKQYFMYYWLLPFLSNIFEQGIKHPSILHLEDKIHRPFRPIGSLCTNTERKKHTVNFLVGWAITLGLRLANNIPTKQWEYDLDRETVTKLDCAQGGLKLLKIRDKANLLPWMNLLYMYFATGISFITGRWYMPTPEYAEVKFPRKSWPFLLSALIEKAPGTMATYSNSLSNAMWNMPIAHYFSPYPTIASRIEQLNELSQGSLQEDES